MSHSLGSASAELPADLDVLIIGGGVMGLSLAYNLAREATAVRRAQQYDR